MKNQYNFYKSLCIKIFLAFVTSLIFQNCNKDIEEVELPTLIPSSIEETGGNWKMIVVSDVQSVSVAEPKNISSQEYISELSEVKSLSSKLSDQQNKAIKYWSAGGVVRWNEIIRELIAKYNLAPVANADGTYSAPDATKPTTYPEFPFANPPYAARALALLTVAQYDALVATWHYKYKFNRQAPYKVDNSIKTGIPASDLPSYPSEDAVIAATSLELMKFLFPGEVEYLTEKAEEQKMVRLWAGANVKSDITAGDSLGRKIAAQIISYAKKDGMKDAGKFTPEMKLACEDLANKNFGSSWKSLELPARPPMLGSYGFVKTWLFDEATKIAIRPSAPPSLNSQEFKDALDELRGYSKNLTREQFRIVSFWADGTGTYTPPGHWNRIAADLIVKNRFNELRTARTFALMNMALVDAGICCWDTKYHFYVPRPSQVDPNIKTATGLPNFPSYTSGHSTFSAAAATVLGYVFPSEKGKLEAMAVEASNSRIYGGIHYRFDSEAGLVCGKKIGQFAIDKGKEDNSPQ